MKITIPTPCKEKLQDDNFCSKCQHQIIDFSKLTNNEVSDEFQLNKVHCGIFHPNQLNQNLIKKTISNVMIFSAFGLMGSSLQAQDKIFCAEPLTPKNDSVQTETLKFKIIVNKDSNLEIQDFTTFRLLINNEIIESDLKIGEEYEIKFDIQKGVDIDIRLASNETMVELFRNYTSNNLPKEIKLQLSDFKSQAIIMGKIAVKR